MDEKGRRRSAWLPLLLVLLLGAVCAALLLVVVPDAGDPRPDVPADPGAAASGPAAGASDVLPPPGRSLPPLSGPVVVGGGGTPPEALVASSGDSEDADVLDVRGEAQRRVFDGRAEGGTFLGTRWPAGGRRAGGTFGGVGNRPKLEGRVVDADTGAPIAGADVITLYADDEGWGKRLTTTVTDADGAFVARPPLRHQARGVLLARAPGYEQARSATDALPEEWRLTPFRGVGRGTVRGRAANPDGAPLHGMLLVTVRSEHGDRAKQFAWSDASGTFELSGLHPGRWRLSLRKEEPVEVTVVAEGLATARLVADAPDSPAPETPGADRRMVEIAGLPDGTVLRAEGGRDVFWRAVVRDGFARFELPFGLWVLTIDRPGGDVMPIHVREDDAPRRLDWAPDRGDE